MKLAEYLAGLLAALCGMLMIYALAALVQLIPLAAPIAIPLPGGAERFVVDDRKDFLAYALSLLLVPGGIYFFLRWAQPLLRDIARQVQSLLALLATGLAGLLLWHIPWGAGPLIPQLSPGGWQLFALSFVLAMMLVLRQQQPWMLLGLATSSALLLGLAEHALVAVPWPGHFDPIAWSYVQLLSGKALTQGHLHAQYGLYNFFLWAVFGKTVHSVATYTLLMALVSGTAYLLMALLLFSVSKNKWWAFSSWSIYLLFGTKVFARVVRGDSFIDPYYQYFPLRYVFVPLFCLLAWWYLARPQRGRFVVGSAMAGVALLWNLDTGAICLFSWVALLGFQSILVRRESLFHFAKQLAAVLLLALAAVLAVSALQALLVGKAIKLSNLLFFQQVFAGSGYFMLPMPTVGTWVIPIFILLFGLGVVGMRLCAGALQRIDELTFFVVILGLGVFSYYVGRSHEAILLTTWHPAILVALLLVTQGLPGKGRLHHLTAVGFVGIGLYCFAFLLQDNLKVAQAAWAPPQETAPLQQLAAQIAAQHQARLPGQELLILSRAAAVLHLESGIPLPSQWDFPSPIESMTLAMQQEQAKAIGKCAVPNLLLDHLHFPILYFKDLKQNLLIHYRLMNMDSSGMWFQANCANPTSPLLLDLPATQGAASSPVGTFYFPRNFNLDLAFTIPQQGEFPFTLLSHLPTAFAPHKPGLRITREGARGNELLLDLPRLSAPIRVPVALGKFQQIRVMVRNQQVLVCRGATQVGSGNLKAIGFHELNLLRPLQLGGNPDSDKGDLHVTIAKATGPAQCQTPSELQGGSR